MKAASKAKLVIGYPCVGPTCSAVSAIYAMQSWGESSFRFVGSSKRPLS